MSSKATLVYSTSRTATSDEVTKNNTVPSTDAAFTCNTEGGCNEMAKFGEKT